MTQEPTPAPGPTPVFDPSDPRQQKPKLRPVRGFPAQHQDQQMLALADAQQISDRVVFTTPAAQVVLPHFTGEKDLDSIVREVGQGLTRPWLEAFVAQLEGAGLIEGKTFTGMLEKLKRDFDSRDVLPPGSSIAFAEAIAQEHAGEQTLSEEEKTARAPAALRTQFDHWIDQALKDADDPSLDDLPRAVVAPHLDYGRGWLNFAHTYGRLRVVDTPDRVIVLGTNHFGFGTGVVGCDKGYESPLGVMPMDAEFKDRLCRALGEEDARRLFEHRYDHEREHSIELQIPWLQHVFGEGGDPAPMPVFAALVHDPARNAGESYDGEGLGLLPFVEGLKQAIVESPGRTLIVASVDLSHVGPQFGDQVKIADLEDEEATAFREKTIQHDREMLQLVLDRKPEELVASMAWMQNPTRWCSVGALVATLKTVEPESVRLLNYAAAVDAHGAGMVSACAMAMA
ncbi:MAG: AmmeMemoRadiSam system protein B [Planctomycetota bacterium]|nr:MAG: AmmeMemoRadiSam system protein B [Planctomycetota bacterium]